MHALNAHLLLLPRHPLQDDDQLVPVHELHAVQIARSEACSFPHCSRFARTGDGKHEQRFVVLALATAKEKICCCQQRVVLEQLGHAVKHGIRLDERRLPRTCGDREKRVACGA
jgi:hypothetical protein